MKDTAQARQTLHGFAERVTAMESDPEACALFAETMARYMLQRRRSRGVAIGCGLLAAGLMGVVYAVVSTFAAGGMAEHAWALGREDLPGWQLFLAGAGAFVCGAVIIGWSGQQLRQAS